MVLTLPTPPYSSESGLEMMGGQDVRKGCHRSLAGAVFHGILPLDQWCEGRDDCELERGTPEFQVKKAYLVKVFLW